MSSVHYEFIVEDQSMEVFLDGFIRSVIVDATYQVYSHQGKSDLIRKLPSRLRGYAGWIPSNWRIVILLDRDDDDCVLLRERMDEICRNAGLTVWGDELPGHWGVASRIAIEELEAWYFGSWESVLAAFPRVPASVPKKAAYRDPDAIRGGTWETFERILQRAGYYPAGLPKVEVATMIGKLIDPARSSSGSFNAFCRVLNIS